MMPVERSMAICALLVHDSQTKKRVFRRYLESSKIHKFEASTDKSHTCFYTTINFQASRYASPNIAFFLSFSRTSVIVGKYKKKRTCAYNTKTKHAAKPSN